MSVTKWITKGQVFELLIWRFPEIGVPPSSHPFLDGIFPYKPTSYWGTSMAMDTTIQRYPDHPWWTTHPLHGSNLLSDLCTAGHTLHPTQDDGGLPWGWHWEKMGWLCVGFWKGHGYIWETMIDWLVVGPPLWKIWKSIGMMTFPIYGKIKSVPNHQPVDVGVRLNRWLARVMGVVSLFLFGS